MPRRARDEGSGTATVVVVTVKEPIAIAVSSVKLAGRFGPTAKAGIKRAVG
jgi:hypothetical protein